MERQTEEFNNYIIVEYGIDLMNDFYELYSSIHGFSLPKEHFIKKASTAFAGCNIIGFITYEKSTGEVAAFYGVYPVLVNHRGCVILAAQSGDTLTHANHRRQGLFEKVFFMTKEKCEKVGVQFIFGFPNSNSAPGFKKFGWSFYPKKDLHLYHKRSLIARIENKLFPRNSVNRLRKQEIPKDGISSAGFQSDVIRSPEYFQYKSNLSNAKFYKLNTCVIWAKTEINTIIIGDVKINMDASVESVVSELQCLLKKINLCNLYTSLSNTNPLLKELEKIDGIKVNEMDFIAFDFINSLTLEDVRYCKADEDTF
jgi:hypothetical protein